MEYAPAVILKSDFNLKRLSGIQYQALKIIYKEPYLSSSTTLHSISKIQPFKERIYELSIKYLERQINNNNPLITKLYEQIPIQSGKTITPIEKLVLNFV